MPLCVQSRGSNSISLYDSRQREEERRFMPPTAAAVAARDINVGEESRSFPQEKKWGTGAEREEKSWLGISLLLAIYSNIKLCLPVKTDGERRQMQIFRRGQNSGLGGKTDRVNNTDAPCLSLVSHATIFLSFLPLLLRVFGLRQPDGTASLHRRHSAVFFACFLCFSSLKLSTLACVTSVKYKIPPPRPLTRS